MGYWTNLRVKTIDFCRRNRKKLLVALIIWLVIIIINHIWKNQPQTIQAPSTTYTPHISVMDEKQEVPKKYQEPIENLIDTYFNYCNNKQYQEAYNLITEDCREKYYPTLEQFQGYIDEVFEGKKKIYNIQSYSIVDNKYIYNIRILDDILANGTTDGYYYYEEKFVLIEENGEMKLSIAEYVGEEPQNIILEDDNLIINVVSKTIDYKTETYEIEITNKTDNFIVISDNTQNDEILFYLDNGDIRKPINMFISQLYIKPNSIRTQSITIDKYYDENAQVQKIAFGAIRILKQYDWSTGTTQENLDNAVKLYGLDLKF